MIEPTTKVTFKLDNGDKLHFEVVRAGSIYLVRVRHKDVMILHPHRFNRLANAKEMLSKAVHEAVVHNKMSIQVPEVATRFVILNDEVEEDMELDRGHVQGSTKFVFSSLVGKGAVLDYE